MKFGSVPSGFEILSDRNDGSSGFLKIYQDSSSYIRIF